MLNLLSGVLLLTACAYFGLQVKRVYRIRHEVFWGLYEFTTALKSEISHIKTPIEDFAQMFLNGNKGAASMLLGKYLSGLPSGYLSAEEVLLKIKSPYLSRADGAVISEFLFQLGRNGLEGELKHLERYGSEFQRRRDKAFECLKKEGDMYYKLCVLLGVALMVIVV